VIAWTEENPAIRLLKLGTKGYFWSQMESAVLLARRFTLARFPDFDERFHCNVQRDFAQRFRVMKLEADDELSLLNSIIIRISS
jgi:hypothetical protein